MKKFRNAAVGLVVIGFTLVLTLCTYYNINMGKVSKDSTPKEVTIKAGSINSIATTLKSYFADKENVKGKCVVTVTTSANATIENGASGFTAAEVNSALTAAGLNSTALKGNGWNPASITITYDTSDGKVTYTASSDHYHAAGSSKIESGKAAANAGGNGNQNNGN